MLGVGLSGGLAQEKVKFPVGVGTKTIGTNMFWLATKKAFFDDSGPEVQPVLLGGGTAINMQALVSESFLVVPLLYAAEEQGLNVLGYYKDYIPNYQLTVMSVKRGWAERNRALLVRFIKGALRANHWLFANKDAATEFLAKEIQIAPELARKGWEYYTTNRIWHPNLALNTEGMKVALEILAEESKFTPPDPLKYIDRSYLQQALEELVQR